MAWITEIERKVAKKYWRKIDMDFLWWGEKIFFENGKIFKNSKNFFKSWKNFSNELKKFFDEKNDFSYSFKSMKFVEDFEAKNYNEKYWASDLHDLFEWKQEMCFRHFYISWKNESLCFFGLV